MLSDLAVFYLFCGGAGAGALVITCALLVIARRRRSAESPQIPWYQGDASHRAAAWAFLLGTAALALGIVCLIVDLGRADRIVSLFSSPHLTWVSAGSFLLAIELALGVYLSAVSFLQLPGACYRFIGFGAATACVVGVGVMLYTGLLLFSMHSVALWANPCVPLLFLFSSFSSGCGVFFIAALLAGEHNDAYLGEETGLVLVADSVAVAIETVIAALFVATSAVSARASAQQSAGELFFGGDSGLTALWWAGYVLCGIAVPLAVEAAVVLRNRKGRIARTGVSLQMFALVAVFILAGSASMRFGVAWAGQHPDASLAADAGQTYAGTAAQPQIRLDNADIQESGA